MRIPLLLAMLAGGFQTVGKSLESEHRVGPGGLQGWTLSYVVETISNQGPPLAKDAPEWVRALEAR